MRGEWVRKPDGLATVVFVHGILSSGEGCWNNANGAYWPELLKNETELEAVGIYVYSYQTGFDSGSYSLSNVVDDLKEHFFTLDHVADSRKIVFVCHSMGGIVVRKFIVERLNDLLDCNIEIGLFLVASPSLGSDYANWLEPIAKFAGHEQAKALRFNQDNQWLTDLDKTFMNLKESKRLTLYGKELLEDKFVTLKSIWRKQVVQPFSGNRYFGESFKVAGSDHFSIAKPEDSNAVQHRLLIEFIKTLFGRSGKILTISDATIGSSPSKSVSFSNAEQKGFAASEQKLRNRLITQLKRPELSLVVKVFFNTVNENCPDLLGDCERIVDYLLKDQGDGDNRRYPLLWFLDAAVLFKDDQKLMGSLQDLFAYLLQTLVCKCEEKDHGMTKIPVKYRSTVELIDAAKKTAGLIPTYAEENLEFKNGRRNERFFDLGDFQPPTGTWEPELICREIASEILKSLGEPSVTPEDALQMLEARLSRYDYDPSKSRLQAVMLHRDKLDQHPLFVPGVAELFGERTGHRVPVYVFGKNNGPGSADAHIHNWLHVEEEKIRALVVEQNPIVKIPENQEKTIGQSATAPSLTPSVFISYSSKDRAIVEFLDKKLRENGLQVIVDYRDLQPGKNITDFIAESVKTSAATLCVISRASLLSGWVSHEVTSTFHLRQWNEAKKFIAGFLEDDFFEPAFRLDLTKQIDHKIAEIEQLIPEYGKQRLDTEELNIDKTRLYDLRNNLGKILHALKENLSVDLREPNFAAGIDRVVNTLKDSN
jgi:hypothetical protein